MWGGCPLSAGRGGLSSGILGEIGQDMGLETRDWTGLGTWDLGLETRDWTGLGTRDWAGLGSRVARMAG